MGIKHRPADSLQSGCVPSPEARPPAPCAHARTYLLRAATVVELRGELDLAAAVEVQAHLDAATEHPNAQVIVDLRPVEFLDCAGLALLCRARRRTLEHLGQLTLLGTRPWHLRILHAAGLGSAFRQATTMQDALAPGP